MCTLRLVWSRHGNEFGNHYICCLYKQCNSNKHYIFNGMAILYSEHKKKATGNVHNQIFLGELHVPFSSSVDTEHVQVLIILSVPQS